MNVSYLERSDFSTTCDLKILELEKDVKNDEDLSQFDLDDILEEDKAIEDSLLDINSYHLEIKLSKKTGEVANFAEIQAKLEKIGMRAYFR